MPNQNHPRTRKSRKWRRKHRSSGDIVSPTEFWTNEDGQVVENSDSSYVDASLSPVHVPISEAIAEANRVLGGDSQDTFPPASTPKMGDPPQPDDRLVEAIATRVEQKMMGQFNALSQQLNNTLGGRIKELEDKVGHLESENKRLTSDLRALSVAGVDPENASSIVDMVKQKVEEVMQEKQVLCKKKFDYDCTVVAIGVTELPGEDPRQIAETLPRDGLRLPHLINSIVRTCRLPFNTKTGKSGHVKIEMENPEVQKQITAVTGRLKGYTALGHKVIVRSSQPLDTRVMVGNMHTLVKAMKLNNELTVTPHGSIRPLTQFQQQYQMGQQQMYQSAPPQQMTQSHMTQPVAPQMAHQQMGQVTQPLMTNQFSYAVQPSYAQQQQSVQQPSQPQLAPQRYQNAFGIASQMGQQPTVQSQARPQSAPNYSAPNTYANVTRTTGTIPPQVSSMVPPTSTQSIAQTLQAMVGQG